MTAKQSFIDLSEYTTLTLSMRFIRSDTGINSLKKNIYLKHGFSTESLVYLMNHLTSVT